MDSNRFDQLTRTVSAKLSRRQALGGGLAGLFAFALSGRSLPALAQDATPEAASSEHPAFLFVQLADSGTWTPKPDEEGVYLLTLSGTGEQTLFFSDRPDRIVGTMETGRFLDALGFTPVEPPNAAIVVTTPEGERDVLVVELFNPVYTRTYGEDGEEFLTYEAIVLNAYQGAALEEWAPQADDDQLPPEFSNVSLFIDDCADLSGCYKWDEYHFRQVYIGEIPGGPYGRCFDWGNWRCRPCEHDDGYYDSLCQQLPDCQFSDCFTDNCGGLGIC